MTADDIKDANAVLMQKLKIRDALINKLWRILAEHWDCATTARMRHSAHTARDMDVIYGPRRTETTPFDIGSTVVNAVKIEAQLQSQCIEPKQCIDQNKSAEIDQNPSLSMTQHECKKEFPDIIEILDDGGMIVGEKHTNNINTASDIKLAKLTTSDIDILCNDIKAGITDPGRDQSISVLDASNGFTSLEEPKPKIHDEGKTSKTEKGDEHIRTNDPHHEEKLENEITSALSHVAKHTYAMSSKSHIECDDNCLSYNENLSEHLEHTEQPGYGMCIEQQNNQNSGSVNFVNENTTLGDMKFVEQELLPASGWTNVQNSGISVLDHNKQYLDNQSETSDCENNDMRDTNPFANKCAVANQPPRKDSSVIPSRASFNIINYPCIQHESEIKQEIRLAVTDDNLAQRDQSCRNSSARSIKRTNNVDPIFQQNESNDSDSIVKNHQEKFNCDKAPSDSINEGIQVHGVTDSFSKKQSLSLNIPKQSDYTRNRLPHTSEECSKSDIVNGHLIKQPMVLLRDCMETRINILGPRTDVSEKDVKRACTENERISAKNSAVLVSSTVKFAHGAKHSIDEEELSSEIDSNLRSVDNRNKALKIIIQQLQCPKCQDYKAENSEVVRLFVHMSQCYFHEDKTKEAGNMIHITCPVCSVTLNNQLKYVQHLATHYKTEQDNQHVTNAPAKCTSSSNTYNRERGSPHDESSPNKSSIQSTRTGNPMCLHCGHSNSYTTTAFLSHLRAHGESASIQDTTSNNKLPYRLTMPNRQQETLQQKTNSISINCTLCSKHFDKKVIYDHHIEKCGQRFRCLKCLDFACPVEKKDMLTAHMCECCMIKTGRASLGQSLNFKCFFCDTIAENQSTFYNHVFKTHLSEKSDLSKVLFNLSESEQVKCTSALATCSMDEKSASTSTRQWSEKKNDHAVKFNTEFPFKCLYCGCLFRTDSELLAHVTRHEKQDLCVEEPMSSDSDGENKSESDTEEEAKNAELHECHLCSKIAKNAEHLIYHKIQKHNMRDEDFSPYICHICKKHFKNLAILRRHRTNVHIDTAPSPCGYCDKVFRGKRKLRIHEKTHTSTLFCKICNLRVPHVTFLRKHMLTHEPGTFQCEFCSEMFRRKDSLDNHIFCEHGKDKVPREQCPHCEKKFLTRTRLRLHIRDVHRAKTSSLTCQVCGVVLTGKKVRLQSRYQNHLKTHSEKKDNPCNVCNKKFKTNAGLKNHLMAAHDNTRNFKCSLCEDSFKLKHHLTAHMVKHTGERKFECTVCSKAFARKQILDTHILSHTGERPFHCKECGKDFLRKTDLNKHMRNLHASVEYSEGEEFQDN